MEAYRTVATRNVVHHGENGAGGRGRSLFRDRSSNSTTRRACAIVFRHCPGISVVVAVVAEAAVTPTRCSVIGRHCGASALLITARSGGRDFALSFSLNLAVRRFVIVMMHGRVHARHRGQSRRDRTRRRRGPCRRVRCTGCHGKCGERSCGGRHERQGRHGGYDFRCSRVSSRAEPLALVMRNRRGSG